MVVREVNRREMAGQAGYATRLPSRHFSTGKITAPALRILVVDDEAINAMLFADLLEAMGYEVCAIEATEAGAIAAAVRRRPDLMIVDAHLQGGRGASVVAAILRVRFVPHVFVSGDSMLEQQCPRTTILQKPFREPDVVRAIDSALSARFGA